MNKFDFAGWVTKNDIRCSDGVTIRHDAFRENDGSQVPIVWQHNYSSPSNVLGHMLLQHRDEGVYGYGFLNDTENAQDAKSLLQHGDLNAMSIGARGIRKNGDDVVHGQIYEVSLVLKGANPGAIIEHVMQHSAYDSEETMIVQTGITQDLLHADNDEGDEMVEKTIEEVLATLNDEQQAAVGALLEAVSEADLDEEVEEEDVDDIEDGEQDDLGFDADGNDSESGESDTTQQSIFLEGEDTLKHNAFNQNGFTEEETLTHADMDVILSAAVEGRANSLAEVLVANGVATADLKHGLVGMESLFPQPSLEGGVQVYNPGALNVEKIMGQFGKVPMSRIKNIFANVTEDEARARGYIKGNQKLDAIEEVFFRETTPGTIVRREKIDRDDLLDLQEGGFDVVQFMQQNQQAKLKEEIVRAAFFGDGRPLTLADGTRNPDKISELHIRPIVKDHELFVIKTTTQGWNTIVDDVVAAYPAYQGSGSPSLYINPFDLAKLKTLKDKNGRYLYAPSMDNNQVPGNANIAAYFMCKEVVEYREVPIGTVVIGNLNDYAFGMAKNGQVATFDSFDLDFNQQKYLIETRLSGAIRTPKSFIVVNVTDKGNTDLSSLDFSSKGLQQKPTFTVNTDPTEVKGVGKRAVGYDSKVNGVQMTEEEKKLGEVETKPGKPSASAPGASESH